MQLAFYSQSLTYPTVQTLREYATLRFNQLSRVLPKFNGEHYIKISVHRERYLFYVTVEVTIPQKLVVKVKHQDLRAAIDMAYSTLKRSLTKNKEKAHRR